MRCKYSIARKCIWWLIWAFPMVISMSCTRDIPRYEPTLLTGQQRKTTVKEEQSQRIRGIVSGNGHINAVLQVIARFYKEEVDRTTNTPLKKVVTQLTCNRLDPIEAKEVLLFSNTLPEFYKNSGDRGDVLALLKSMHHAVPFLGKVVLEDPVSHVCSEISILELCSPLDQHAQTVSSVSNLTALIRASQEVVGAADNTQSTILFAKRHSSIQKKVFHTLPDKLCISLVRSATKEGEKRLCDQLDLFGTEFITIQHDLTWPNLTSSSFALKAFLVMLQDTNPDHWIAFVQSDGMWYCANDDKITAVSHKEAIYASQRGAFFFYKKKHN